MNNLSKLGVSELKYMESLDINGGKGNYIEKYYRWVFSFYSGVWDGFNGNCTIHEC